MINENVDESDSFDLSKVEKVIKIIDDSRKCGYTIPNCYQNEIEKLFTILLQVRNIFYDKIKVYMRILSVYAKILNGLYV